MVMYFPSSLENAWRYQTTSSQYGQFYDAIHRETERTKAQHSACDRRYAQLSEELHEAKVCLEMVTKGGVSATQRPYGPRGPCCFEAAEQGRPCKCREKSPGQKNPYNLNSVKPYGCGQPPEPQLLTDHVRCYHPRLPRPGLFPKITFGSTDRNGRPLSGGNSHGGEFGVRDGRKFCPALPARGMSCSAGGGGGGGQSTKVKVLPNESRYGFYRYYGHAGQGAKSSKGYRLKNK